jgi:glycosyltransferase involved in cell wall biosynthesis
MDNYKNLRVFMMESNKGTFITSNTIMSLAKYDNILRFDADDIMMPDLIKTIMEKAESEDVDRIMFLCQNFGNSNNIIWANGQIFMKHWVFDYFGGFMPWRCEGDGEFVNRVDKFLTVVKIPTILMERRIHDSNLTVKKKIGLNSVFRAWHRNYRFNISLNIKNINDAVIIKIVNDFQEIFPNTTIK